MTNLYWNLLTRVHLSLIVQVLLSVIYHTSFVKETCQNLINVNTLIVETLKPLLANDLSKNYFSRIHFVFYKNTLKN